MVGMMRAMGLTLVGHHHRGIDDCRNLATLYGALLERGGVVEVTGNASKRRSHHA